MIKRILKVEDSDTGEVQVHSLEAKTIKELDKISGIIYDIVGMTNSVTVETLITTNVENIPEELPKRYILTAHSVDGTVYYFLGACYVMSNGSMVYWDTDAKKSYFFYLPKSKANVDYVWSKILPDGARDVFNPENMTLVETKNTKPL